MTIWDWFGLSVLVSLGLAMALVHAVTDWWLW